MVIVGLIIAVVVGAAIGFVIGNVARGGAGPVGDAVVGAVGALIAANVLPRVGVSLGGGYLGLVLLSAIGAVVLVVVSRAVRR